MGKRRELRARVADGDGLGVVVRLGEMATPCSLPPHMLVPALPASLPGRLPAALPGRLLGRLPAAAAQRSLPAAVLVQIEPGGALGGMVWSLRGAVVGLGGAFARKPPATGGGRLPDTLPGVWGGPLRAFCAASDVLWASCPLGALDFR